MTKPKRASKKKENIISNFEPLEKTVSPKKVLQELELSKNVAPMVEDKPIDYQQVIDKLVKENQDLQLQLIEQPNIKLDLMEQIAVLKQEMEMLKLENLKQVEFNENLKNIAKGRSKHEKESEYSSKLESVIDLFEHLSLLTVSNIEKIKRTDLDNAEHEYTCFTCKLKGFSFKIYQGENTLYEPISNPPNVEFLQNEIEFENGMLPKFFFNILSSIN
ncbi:hypothetical protein HDV06_004839 [Boothiomyces sp. JEL0866]|nr:hypothetical protein HDV06_004839 [Boothiomyces sp. JEL0866]